MRRILLLFLSAFAVMTAMADGNVIEIWTVAQLKALRDNVNLQSGNDTYAGKTVKLMTDLTISDNTWVPIGLDNDTHSFQGTFDGQGYTITLTGVTGNTAVLGVFGYVGSSGVIKNLKVAGSIANTETGSTTYTGGIAGNNYGTIQQCANLANITGRYDVGGIAGENRGTITNCYNQGNIGGTGSETTSKFLGGIVGDNQSPGTITYCYAKCDIEDEGTKGGIVANNNGTVSNCSFDVTLYNTSNKLTDSTTLTGNALKSDLDNSIWTFTDGQLPELTVIKNKIIRLGNTIDNSSIITAYNGQTNTVELSGRTLNKGKWNTLCLPFSLSSAQITNVFGAGTLVKTLSSYTNNGTTVTISFTTANSIEAGKPYIVMPTIDITNPVSFTGVTIDETINNVTDGDATFKGNYAPVDLTADDKKKLFLASNMLYYPTGSVTVKPFRAYFELTDPVPTASGAPNLVIDFGETTGVGELRTENRRIENSFYDLQGRRLNGKPTQKGIYIHHGKKEVLK